MSPSDCSQPEPGAWNTPRIGACSQPSSPGVLARSIIVRRSYKQDTKIKQTADQYVARKDLLRAITNNGVYRTHGVHVAAPLSLADDPGADHLDALLCAIQAAWAWTQRDTNFGVPHSADPLEGWIADPALQAP